MTADAWLAAPRNPRRWAAAGTALIVIATFVAYLPAMQAGFIWDDNDYIEDNRLVQEWNTLPRIWFTTETPQYYPLVFTTFWIEHKLWGLHPTGYHIVNVVLHALNALLVWKLAARLRIPAAWFIGAVFALHPVHVESVAWVTERKNVLSGLLGLLSVLAYLRFDETRRWPLYAAALLLFLAALFSKTVIAMLIACLPLMLFYRNGRLTWRDVLLLLPFIAIGAFKGLLTAYLERTHVGAQGEEWSQTFWQRALLIAPSAYAFYAAKILWPHPLIFIYPRWDLATADWTWYLPFAGISIAVVAAALLVRKLGWGPLLLLVFAAINLFPALGFLNVYPHRFSFVADHFQYIASLGFIVLFVTGALWLARRLLPPPAQRAVVAAGGAGLLLVFGVLTFRQGFVYQDVQHLWEDTLRANPVCPMAMVNLGDVYRRQGRLDEAETWLRQAYELPYGKRSASGILGGVLYRQKRYAESIEALRLSLTYRPRDEAGIHSNIGLALQQLGRGDEALAELKIAIDMQPNEPRLHYNLANVHAVQGRFDDALTAIRRALELAPGSAAYQAYAGTIQLARREHAAAIEHFRAALDKEPARAEAQLGAINTLYQSGRYAEALATCRAALAKRPNDAGLLDRLVWILATCPDDAVRKPPEAIRLADQLVKSLGPAAPAVIIDTLGAAAAAQGDFQTAVMMAERALARARQEQDAALALEIEARLDGYRAGRAYVHTPR